MKVDSARPCGAIAVSLPSILKRSRSEHGALQCRAGHLISALILVFWGNRRRGRTWAGRPRSTQDQRRA
jgi:hypothetical protein